MQMKTGVWASVGSASMALYSGICHYGSWAKTQTKKVDSATLVTLLGVCLLYLTIPALTLSSTIDLGLLLWIALMERASLKVERLNHELYREFFQARTRWYNARNKQKPPVELPGGQMADVYVEDVTSDE